MQLLGRPGNVDLTSDFIVYGTVTPKAPWVQCISSNSSSATILLCVMLKKKEFHVDVVYRSAGQSQLEYDDHPTVNGCRRPYRRDDRWNFQNLTRLC